MKLPYSGRPFKKKIKIIMTSSLTVKPDTQLVGEVVELSHLEEWPIFGHPGGKQEAGIFGLDH